MWVVTLSVLSEGRFRFEGISEEFCQILVADLVFLESFGGWLSVPDFEAVRAY